MLKGTERLFPTEYNQFKTAMIDAAEKGELPVVLQLDEIRDFTLKDVQDMFYEFNRDTGFEITGFLFLCDDCGALHMRITVDYPEKENTLLQ